MKIKGAYRITIDWVDQALFGTCYDRRPEGKYKSNVIKVLNWAVDHRHISDQQKEVLKSKFMKVL
jgi:hypothetical protein